MSLDLAALEKPIRRILTAPGTDLSTISARRVRKTLLEDPDYAFLGLTPEMVKARRTEVDQVIAGIFEDVSAAAAATSGERSTQKHGRDEGEEVDADADTDGGYEAGGASGPPPTEPSEDADADVVTKAPKKKKGKKSVEESDAALARKLSTEINSRSRRGAALAASSSSNPRKAKRKTKKSAETIGSEDEDGGDGEGKSKKRSGPKGGFAKEYTLSVPLSAVLEVEKLSRPQVVKKLWEYIRLHELQNPLNKKEIVCDDALRAVFAVDKIDMFKMNKVLGQHLIEE